MIAAPASRTDWAYEQLREAILFGDVAPGARLRVSDWTARLGISQTPLREAFQRLAAESLVDYDSQRGVHVAETPVDEMHHVYALRLDLEPKAVADSVAHATDAWRSGLTRAFDGFRAIKLAPDSGQRERLRAHGAFHSALRACCSSRWLLRFSETLAEQSVRFMLSSLPNRGDDADSEVEEHRAIYAAAMAADAALAETLTRAHLQRTVDAIASAFGHDEGHVHGKDS